VKGTVTEMWGYRGDGYGMHDDAGAGFWVMMVMMLVVLVAVLALLYLLVVRTGGTTTGRAQDSGSGESRTADRLLEERFARGEIDEDEYRHRRAVLHGG
jgi:putative membrane protein